MREELSVIKLLYVGGVSMNVLKIQAYLIKLTELINESGTPPEIKRKMKIAILGINKILLESLKEEI